MNSSKPARTAAILGASADPAKFGNISLRVHREHGYTVYPVNPKGGEIEGLTVERLKTLNAEPGGMPPDEFGEFVKAELERYGNVIRKAGIKLE